MDLVQITKKKIQKKNKQRLAKIYYKHANLCRLLCGTVLKFSNYNSYKYDICTYFWNFVLVFVCVYIFSNLSLLT